MTIEDIENNLPNGFHDANLIGVNIDYVKREVTLDIEVDISSPESRSEGNMENYRRGILTLLGLLFCVIEPPDFQYADLDNKGLWITGSNPVRPAEIPTKFPTKLSEDAFVHFFYISNWNASIYLAAMDARFEWC